MGRGSEDTFFQRAQTEAGQQGQGEGLDLTDRLAAHIRARDATSHGLGRLSSEGREGSADEGVEKRGPPVL